MKVTYLYAATLPNMNANSGAVADLCGAMSVAGADVQIVHLGNPSDENEIRGKYGLDARVAVRSVNAGRGAMYYPTLINNAWPYLQDSAIVTRVPAVATICGALGKRVLFEIHQTPDSFRSWRYWRYLTPLVGSKNIRLFAVTNSLRDELKRDAAFSKFDCFLSPSSANDYLDEATTPSFDIGYVGSFKNGKGADFIYELAKRLPERSFVFYGDITPNPALAESLHALGNCTIRGFTPRSEIKAALASFRVGLAPYAAEGFGGGADGTPFVSADHMSSLKIVEYMSAAKFVVASDIPSVREVVRNEIEGLLCPVGDVEQWCKSVELGLDDDEVFRRLSSQARIGFVEKASIQRRAQLFLDVLDQ